MTLRCYAERRDAVWEALCVDLDISAHGASFQEARESLHKAIHMYLERVAELPEADRRELLSRRAPLRYRIKFALIGVMDRLFRDSHDRYHGFTISDDVPAPA